MKVLIGKQTAEGEQVSVECSDADLPAALYMLDSRLREMNSRVIAAMTAQKTLACPHCNKALGNVQQLVTDVFETLYGRKVVPEMAPATTERKLEVIDGGKK